jgi:hypothetical protein
MAAQAQKQKRGPVAAPRYFSILYSATLREHEYICTEMLPGRQDDFFRKNISRRRKNKSSCKIRRII